MRRADQSALEQRVNEICHVRIRYDHRRIQVLHRREGWGRSLEIARLVLSSSLRGSNARSMAPSMPRDWAATRGRSERRVRPRRRRSGRNPRHAAADGLDMKEALERNEAPSDNDSGVQQVRRWSMIH